MALVYKVTRMLQESRFVQIPALGASSVHQPFRLRVVLHDHVELRLPLAELRKSNPRKKVDCAFW